MSELTNSYDYENIKKRLAGETKYDVEDDDTIFNNEDFVLMKKKNEDGTEEIIGGGYKIQSFFMENGKPILTTFNDNNTELTNDGKEKQQGGKVSTPFENLAVPAGLFYINQRVPTNKKEKEKEHYYENHEVISDTIMDKLFGLVEYNKKQQRKTRKQKTKNTNKQKSRKQR
jgi:hypothetical protein